MKIISSSQNALISFTLGGFECCKSCTRDTNKVVTEFSWFGWLDWPRNVRAQFLWPSGKVFNCLFSIVGIAYQSQNVNNGKPTIKLLDLVLTKQCGVVPGMVDRRHHHILLSLDIQTEPW